MPQTVLITGTGRAMDLGFNLVKRYEHAETLRNLFETKRHDKDGPVFITYEGKPYPW